jgi:hypothetical protein
MATDLEIRTGNRSAIIIEVSFWCETLCLAVGGKGKDAPSGAAKIDHRIRGGAFSTTVVDRSSAPHFGASRSRSEIVVGAMHLI